MALTLLERLTRITNVIEQRGERLVKDPLALSHYKDTLKGVWWYNPRTRELSFSSQATSHMDLDRFPEVKDMRGWVRGRVFQDDKKRIGVFTYTEDWLTRFISGQTASDLIKKIESESGLTVDYFVDELGYDLSEGKKK